MILIITRRIPNLFLHERGTHVHHLNYGIFILSAVGALLVFVTQPNDKLRKLCALLYGIGMALTFDEFGMWLHLGGSYWQRGSFDAVIVILSVFGWIAFLPKWERMRRAHWTVAAMTLLAVVAFYALLFILREIDRPPLRPASPGYRSRRAAVVETTTLKRSPASLCRACY